MPNIAARVIDVYPYRLTPTPEYLLLRRSPEVLYAGCWRMVGGKIWPAETAWQAAFREVAEETGCRPRRLWSLPSANIFYEWTHDCVNVTPAFAAEINADPVLDREHDAFAWLSLEEAVGRLEWPEQRRLLQLTDQILRQGIPDGLIIPKENLDKSY